MTTTPTTTDIGEAAQAAMREAALRPGRAAALKAAGQPVQVAGPALRDPSDLGRYYDLDSFITPSGTADTLQVAQALAVLLEQRPYLFTGQDGQEASPATGQGNLAEQIAAAEQAGDYALAGRLKAQMLAQFGR